MIQLTLYSTSHCHLCEEAEALLMSLASQYDIKWVTIEITDNNHLLKDYGIKIPVIKRVDNSVEISWPFTAPEIVALINANQHQ